MVAAHRLCAAAFPGKTIASSYFTTVGAVRALEGGPNGHLAPHAFPHSSAKEFAAWCWLGNGVNQWNGYAVVADQPALFVAPQDGTVTPPVGAPVAP